MFILLPLRFISEYSLEFQHRFNKNNFMYENQKKLSQPALIFINISARYSMLSIVMILMKNA